jgi:hypothetical protein
LTIANGRLKMNKPSRAPPKTRLGGGQRYFLTDLGGYQFDLSLFGLCHQAFDGLVRGVQGQVEGGPVDGRQGGSLHQLVRLRGLFGCGVDLDPGFVVRPDGQDGKVEGAVS